MRSDIRMVRKCIGKMLFEEYGAPCTAANVKRLCKRVELETHLLHTDLVLNGWHHTPFYITRNAVACKAAIQRILHKKY